MPEIATISAAPASTSTAKSVSDQTDPAAVPTDSSGFAAIIANFAGLVPQPILTPNTTDAANIGEGLPSTDSNLPAQALLSALPAGRSIGRSVPVSQGLPVPTNIEQITATPTMEVAGAAEGRTQTSTDTADENETLKFDVSALFQSKDSDSESALAEPTDPSSTMTQATNQATADLNSALPVTASALPINTASSRAPTLDIDAKLPVHSPQFGEGFAQQVTVLVEHGIQHARLTLNPAELGPVDVQISIQHDEATVQLASHHGGVREAMNDAMPRLRELLEQSGMRLAESGVFTQLPQREHAQQGSSAQQQFNDGNHRAQAIPVVNPLPAGRTLRLGLVDAYV